MLLKTLLLVGALDSTPDFVSLPSLDKTLVLDIRYATTNNFMKAQIYDCAACYLRPEVAKAIVNAQKDLQKKGYGLKLFDCYRPKPYQQRLWDKKPDAHFVAPPWKGSEHSKGAAVDLTIIDAKGKELDMGTPYDYFGKEAYTAYPNLSQEALKNRQLLKSTMENAGFRSIRTEWWHYSYKGKKYPLSSWLWQCKKEKKK